MPALTALAAIIPRMQPSPHAPGPPRAPRWGDDRLDDAFRTIREDVVELKADIKAFEPVVGNVQVQIEKTDNILRDVGELKTAVREIVNRSVARQLVIVSTPLFFGAVSMAVALYTGVLGP